MAVLSGTITPDNFDLEHAIAVDVVDSFRDSTEEFLNALGIADGVEIRKAGSALYQYKVTGNLPNVDRDPGDLVPLVEYDYEEIPVGELGLDPFDKVTSAEAVLKAGYEKAVIRIDNQMMKDVRNKMINTFISFLGNGTGRAEGANLQELLANVDGALADALEDAGLQSDGTVHLVERALATEYLAKANISTQTLFGMTYLRDFLGVEHVLLTNKIQGVIATTVENIHVYGIDFDALSDLKLDYVTDENGLIGIAHEPAYNRVSGVTHVIMPKNNFLAEKVNLIIKGAVNPFDDATVAGESGSATIFGHTVSDLQSNIAVSGNKITGNLAYVTEGALPDYWGDGNFLALKFTKNDADVTKIRVGLKPSKGSGLVELDADMNGAFKITDPKTQKFIVEQSNAQYTERQVYDLSELVCASE